MPMGAAPIRIYWMLIHRFRLTEILAVPQELLKCYCKVMMEEYICCQRYLMNGIFVPLYPSSE